MGRPRLGAECWTYNRKRQKNRMTNVEENWVHYVGRCWKPLEKWLKRVSSESETGGNSLLSCGSSLIEQSSSKPNCLLFPSGHRKTHGAPRTERVWRWGNQHIPMKRTKHAFLYLHRWDLQPSCEPVSNFSHTSSTLPSGVGWVTWHSTSWRGKGLKEEE